MRCHRLTTFCIMSLIVITPLLGSAPAEEIPAKKRCVAVISIDGLPAWAWDDPKLPMPTLRRFTREGVLAKGMTVSNPSVTWPNHTTLVTGVRPAKHGVLFNGFLVRQGERAPAKLESGHDKSELVQAITVYDLAHEAGLTTAQVNWVGMPAPQQNQQMGDLVLVAKEGYAFSGDHEGLPLAKVEAGAYQGHHGYPSTDPDMNASFLAWGYGIRSGAELGRIENGCRSDNSRFARFEGSR
jgi:arylsulfatase A-like enzyme